MNKELRDDLAFAVEYFRKGEFFEEQYEGQEKKIQNAEQQFQNEERKGQILFDLLRVASIIVLVFAGLVILATAIMIFGDTGFNKTDHFILKTLPLGIIVSIALLVYLKFHEKAHDKKFKEIYAIQVQPIIDAAKAEMENIENQVMEYVKENLHRIEFIPMRYRNLSAISFFYDAISDCLADTLKEASNLYEEYLHRCRLEETAQEALAEQRFAMNELIRQQDETNRRLRDIQNAQYWDYLNRKNN